MYIERKYFINITRLLQYIFIWYC